MYHSTIYHSNLYDQSALEIGLGLGLDSELHYFSIFSRRIRKMSTFSSANIPDGNLVLKERTHRIKIKYFMHQYSIRLHNLGNWLMGNLALNCFAAVTLTFIK